MSYRFSFACPDRVRSPLLRDYTADRKPMTKTIGGGDLNRSALLLNEPGDTADKERQPTCKDALTCEGVCLVLCSSC